VSAVPAFLEARRSIRSFLDEPVPRDALDRFVEAACIAPAPHHSRPWRWVVVDTAAGKQALAHGMGEKWREDLDRDGVAAARIDELVAASRRRSRRFRHRARVPHRARLDHYPDEARRRGVSAWPSCRSGPRSRT
jgi:coenzyme F420-0:L-glutamate ligase/coenzyme F420-1:gamma-L-glutamate ligase